MENYPVDQVTPAEPIEEPYSDPQPLTSESTPEPEPDEVFQDAEEQIDNQETVLEGGDPDPQKPKPDYQHRINMPA